MYVRNFWRPKEKLCSVDRHGSPCLPQSPIETSLKCLVFKPLQTTCVFRKKWGEAPGHKVTYCSNEARIIQSIGHGKTNKPAFPSPGDILKKAEYKPWINEYMC